MDVEPQVFVDTSHDDRGGSPLGNDDGDHLDNDGDDLLNSDDDLLDTDDGGDDRSDLEIDNDYDGGDGGGGLDNVANLEGSGNLDSLGTAVDMDIVVELGSLAVDMLLDRVHVTLENLVVFRKYRQMDSMETRCDYCVRELDIVETSVLLFLATDWHYLFGLRFVIRHLQWYNHFVRLIVIVHCLMNFAH